MLVRFQRPESFESVEYELPAIPRRGDLIRFPDNITLQIADDPGSIIWVLDDECRLLHVWISVR